MGNTGSASGRAAGASAGAVWAAGSGVTRKGVKSVLDAGKRLPKGSVRIVTKGGGVITLSKAQVTQLVSISQSTKSLRGRAAIPGFKKGEVTAVAKLTKAQVNRIYNKSRGKPLNSKVPNLKLNAKAQQKVLNQVKISRNRYSKVRLARDAAKAINKASRDSNKKVKRKPLTTDDVILGK